MSHWWDRIPPLLLVVLALTALGVHLGYPSEGLLVVAGVLVGAAIVLETMRRRDDG